MVSNPTPNALSRFTHTEGAKTHLDVDFVATKHDRDVLADTFKITMPVGHILVRDAGGNIKHDYATLPLNVVAVTKTTELFLSCSVPDVEADSAVVC